MVWKSLKRYLGQFRIVHLNPASSTVGFFILQKMAKEIKKNKIKAIDHNGNSWHGITICCKSCGVEFEETSNGYYEPMKYEEDRFNRKCNICRNL
jgi:hypothetical protein